MVVAWALPFLKRGRVIALTIGFAVFSHFILDFFMHPEDLALWPSSRTHLGLGLWHTAYWWWFELAFVCAGCGYYWMRARKLDTFGGRAAWAFAVVVALTCSTRHGSRRPSSTGK